MATTAHCAYCFETLFASLERYDLPDLVAVEQSWEYYNRELAPEHVVEQNNVSYVSDSADRTTELLERSSHHNRPRIQANSLNCHTPLPLLATSQRRTLPLMSTGSSDSTPSLTSDGSSHFSSYSPLSGSSSRTSLSSAHQGAKDKQSHRIAPYDSPMFVTWNTISQSGTKRLRGCIGTFEAQELELGLRTYALTSALEDTRFAPIDIHEFPSLECGVTLLTNFEPAPDPFSWEIGKHGLRISFSHHSRRYGATYLPDVAREQGWSKTETIVSLMHKAGWRGRDEDWHKVRDLNVVRYQGNRVSMKYGDWRAWHDWSEKAT